MLLSYIYTYNISIHSYNIPELKVAPSVNVYYSFIIYNDKLTI